MRSNRSPITPSEPSLRTFLLASLYGDTGTVEKFIALNKHNPDAATHLVSGYRNAKSHDQPKVMALLAETIAIKIFLSLQPKQFATSQSFFASRDLSPTTIHDSKMKSKL
tara:strand:- start:213 stop:542 length:330 start_codon:yes stop_codon:yes gene_type:complete